MKSFVRMLGTGLALTWAISCSRQEKPVVFVAASLADVAASWQTAYQGGFDVHSGASMLLANQIKSGAHADVFVSAGADPVAQLANLGLVARVDTSYLRNNLVMLCAPGIAPPTELAELIDPRFARIAVADPELAPAGKYARKGLEKAGLWDVLKPRMVFTGDVRMAAETVRLATADVAFVYATDVPAGVHSIALDSTVFPIAVYPLAVLAPMTPAKDSLWGFLQSEAAKKIAHDKGFR